MHATAGDTATYRNMSWPSMPFPPVSRPVDAVGTLLRQEYGTASEKFKTGRTENGPT